MNLVSEIISFAQCNEEEIERLTFNTWTIKHPKCIGERRDLSYLYKLLKKGNRQIRLLLEPIEHVIESNMISIGEWCNEYIRIYYKNNTFILHEYLKKGKPNIKEYKDMDTIVKSVKAIVKDKVGEDEKRRYYDYKY